MQGSVSPAFRFQCAQFLSFTLRVYPVTLTLQCAAPNAPRVMQESEFLTNIPDATVIAEIICCLPRICRVLSEAWQCSLFGEKQVRRSAIARGAVLPPELLNVRIHGLIVNHRSTITLTRHPNMSPKGSSNVTRVGYKKRFTWGAIGGAKQTIS